MVQQNSCPAPCGSKNSGWRWGCTVGEFGSCPWGVTGLIGRCGGVWGCLRAVKSSCYPFSNLFIFLQYFMKSQFSFNLINFKIPDQPIPPISPTNLCTHFTERLSVYTAQSIPNLNSSSNSSATHFPNPMRVTRRKPLLWYSDWLHKIGFIILTLPEVIFL